MSKHTPGPWKVPTNTAAIEAGGNLIAETVPTTGAQEAYANAALIAAAPDLLAALEKASKRIRMDFIESDPVGWREIYAPLYADIRSAIAKARGEA